MEKIISSDANDPYDPDTHYLIQKPKTLVQSKESRDKVIKEHKENKENKEQLKELKDKENLKCTNTIINQGLIKNNKTIIPLSTKNDTKPKIFQNIQINLKSTSPKPLKKDKK